MLYVYEVDNNCWNLWYMVNESDLKLAACINLLRWGYNCTQYDNNHNDNSALAQQNWIYTKKKSFSWLYSVAVVVYSEQWLRFLLLLQTESSSFSAQSNLATAADRKKFFSFYLVTMFSSSTWMELLVILKTFIRTFYKCCGLLFESIRMELEFSSIEPIEVPTFEYIRDSYDILNLMSTGDPLKSLKYISFLCTNKYLNLTNLTEWYEIRVCCCCCRYAHPHSRNGR